MFEILFSSQYGGRCGRGARSPVLGDEIAGGFLGQGRSSVSLVSWVRWEATEVF